jgi:hypothetical protein
MGRSVMFDDDPRQAVGNKHSDIIEELALDL